MGSSKYLIRFDDLCPTMNWNIWNRLESILDKYSIKPIVAVVPDNKDPKLIVEAFKSDFWDRVRSWKQKRWSIALHGYQHVYETKNPGILGINNYSEFAGLSYAVQSKKIINGIKVLSRENIQADAWVAPAHSFDETTIKILIECGIKVISDGFLLYPVQRHGALWIPQQLWHFRTMPFGIWTVCFHHNCFKEKNILDFEAEVKRYKNRIISMDSIIAGKPVRRFNIFDSCLSKVFLVMLHSKLKTRKTNA